MSAVNGHAASKQAASASRRARKTPAARQAPVLDVAIIGAGFSGLGTAIRLREQGISDIAILERGDDVGGTWRDNTYPGAACDIPSNLYSFSFAQNPNWSRGYSGSAEILDYIHHLVDRFELRALMRFRHAVTGMAFDEARGVWCRPRARLPIRPCRISPVSTPSAARRFTARVGTTATISTADASP
jgi:hypothetical protein